MQLYRRSHTLSLSNAIHERVLSTNQSRLCNELCCHDVDILHVVYWFIQKVRCQTKYLHTKTSQPLLLAVLSAFTYCCLATSGCGRTQLANFIETMCDLSNNTCCSLVGNARKSHFKEAKYKAYAEYLNKCRVKCKGVSSCLLLIVISGRILQLHLLI